MIGIVFRLSAGQLLGRGRAILMGLLALLPVGLALIFRLGGTDTAPADWVANVFFDGLLTTTLLPLVALVFGTAALGAEIEDGTAVYLLAKPVARSRIIVGKLLAAWLVTAGVVLASGLVGGAIGLGGASGGRLLGGFGIALAAGSLVYCALFVMLSVVTSRALIAGLAYVFIWEGLINGLFSGTRLLSVRHYTLGVADGLVTSDQFEARLAVGSAIVMAVVVVAGSVWFAIRRLERFEIGDVT